MKDWIIRALKTFVQATVAYFIANISMITTHVVEWDFTDWKGWLMPVLVGAVASGISAVWNIILEKMNSRQVNEND